MVYPICYTQLQKHRAMEQELFKKEEIFFVAYDDKLRYISNYAKDKPFLIDCDKSGKGLLNNIKNCLEKDINAKS